MDFYPSSSWSEHSTPSPGDHMVTVADNIMSLHIDTGPASGEPSRGAVEVDTRCSLR